MTKCNVYREICLLLKTSSEKCPGIFILCNRYDLNNFIEKN